MDRNNYEQRLGYTNNSYNPNQPQQNMQGGYPPQQPGYVAQQQGYPNNYEVDPNYQQNIQNKKYRSEASVRSRFPRWFGNNNNQEAPKKPQQQNNVVIYSPSTYEDVQALIDHLKKGEQVIVDFSTVNQTAVYRILDFMSGAIYALNGSIQQITRNIFLFAPQGVTISVPIQFKRQ